MTDEERLAEIQRRVEAYTIVSLIVQTDDVKFLLGIIREQTIALKTIAGHPHCTDESQGENMQYHIGVQDGHRCAANIARSVLKHEVP